MLSSPGTPGAIVILAVWLTQKCLAHSSAWGPALQGPRDLLGPARAAEDWERKALPTQLSCREREVKRARGIGCSRGEDETSAVLPSYTTAYLPGRACSPPAGHRAPLGPSLKMLFSDATKMTSNLGFRVAKDTELAFVTNFRMIPGWDFSALCTSLGSELIFSAKTRLRLLGKFWL